ncbi:MAG: flagellar export protein FliJ [Pseudomonadota bacterium]
MLKSQRFNIIKKLAEKKADESIITFGQCKSKLSAMENQLKKLYQYRDDYNLQFNKAASTGISSTGVQDYLRFINNLNHNIDSLLQVIMEKKTECEKLKFEWLEKNKQVDIYSNVKSKFLEKEKIEKQKQEQKILDEFSTTFSFRNRR